MLLPFLWLTSHDDCSVDYAVGQQGTPYKPYSLRKVTLNYSRCKIALSQLKGLHSIHTHLTHFQVNPWKIIKVYHHHKCQTTAYFTSLVTQYFLDLDHRSSKRKMDKIAQRGLLSSVDLIIHMRRRRAEPRLPGHRREWTLDMWSCPVAYCCQRSLKARITPLCRWDAWPLTRQTVSVNSRYKDETVRSNVATCMLREWLLLDQYCAGALHPRTSRASEGDQIGWHQRALSHSCVLV